jgi:hypothetical protein
MIVFPAATPSNGLSKEWISFAATLLAALIVSMVGTIGAALITKRLQQARDLQDRESQWRSHAIELTKLDAERLMKRREVTREPLEPFILTFLANYRDLSELGQYSPKELYLKILRDRITPPPDGGEQP